MENKIRKVCSNCGSDVWFDAVAIWSEEEQKYVLDSVYHKAECNECGGQTGEPTDIPLPTHEELINKAKIGLERKGVYTKKDNGTLYILAEGMELGMSDYEIKYQAKEYDQIMQEEAAEEALEREEVGDE